MADPATLREQARRLRQAAQVVRDTGLGLDDQVRTLLDRYPLPSRELWQGPYADRYLEELERAKEELTRIGTDADRFADDCEAEARARDAEASRLEAELPAGAV